MYQILQKFDIHWHDGGPSIAMMYHLRRVSDLLCNWKSCLLCYMKDVVLHCSIFFKWNKLVRVRVRDQSNSWCLPIAPMCDESKFWWYGITSLNVFIHWHVKYISSKRNSSSCDCWSYSRTVLKPGSVSNRPVRSSSLGACLCARFAQPCCNPVSLCTGKVGQLVSGHRVAACGTVPL